MNDVLMGILRVRNLLSPPYISVQPSLKVHEISDYDHFAVLGSDGLFDFFSNEEIVKLVYSYISSYPSGDPAKFLVEQLLVRAADCAGMTLVLYIFFSFSVFVLRIKDQQSSKGIEHKFLNILV